MRVGRRGGLGLDACARRRVPRGRAGPPQDITKFEWKVILAYLGASPEEIADVQKQMGRMWR